MKTDTLLINGDLKEKASIHFAPGDRAFVTVTSVAGLIFRGEGTDFFDALSAARGQLESSGWLIVCNGSRKDVYPSPMLRTATFGRRAYVLTSPRTRSRPDTVDIFDPAPDVTFVGTVEEQWTSFENWRNLPLLDDAI